MDSTTSAIAALAAAIFDDAPKNLTWEHLQTLHLQNAAAFWLRGHLPTIAVSWHSIWKAAVVADMKQEAAYRELNNLFQAQQIRFCPLKGADLAWRVYPVSGLRTKCDLDLLVHPDDLQRAFAVLQQNGWKAPYQYQVDHHLPQMLKKGTVLEVHFHLPYAGHIPDAELWSNLLLIDGCRYQLPLEWNLAMLFHHSRHHHWSNGIQLLLDYAFLLKKEGAPDWRKMAALETRFHFSSPALLFGAFPDFFPAGLMPPITVPEDISRTFRSLLLAESRLFQLDVQRIMADRTRFSPAWWWERLKGMRPSSIRIQTGNPKGHYGKLLLGYCSVTWKKLQLFRHYRYGSDPLAFQRLQDEKAVETFLR